MQVKILQITDTHLSSNIEGKWNNTKPNLSLLNIIKELDSINLKEINAIFLTGDISEDMSIESYKYIADKLDILNIPIIWTPGNHDDFDIMTKIFSSYKNFIYKELFSVNNWDFLFLNTKFEDKPYGYIEKDDLIKLEKNLKNSVDQSRYVGIVMHHHSTEVSTPLIDGMMLKNSKEFLDIIEKYNDKVKIVICGHVHNDYKIIKNKICFESAYATSLQLIKGSSSSNFELTSGFKTYNFFENGDFKSKSYLFDSIK